MCINFLSRSFELLHLVAVGENDVVRQIIYSQFLCSMLDVGVLSKFRIIKIFTFHDSLILLVFKFLFVI